MRNLSLRLCTTQIGQLKVENDFLKKKIAGITENCSLEEKRQLIDNQDALLSVRQQCQLLSLPRSSYYYEPLSESEENLALMLHIDELYLEYPFVRCSQDVGKFKIGL
jgi:hypothetical protein